MKDKSTKNEMPAASPDLVAAVKEASKDGSLSCGAAFNLARERDADPSLIGVALDASGIHIAKCQLGLFGYGEKKKIVEPAASVGEALRAAIEGRLADGRLTCAAAWEISAQLRISKMDVASACEALKIKISRCQLGAF